jgi:ribosomal protein S8E
MNNFFQNKKNEIYFLFNKNIIICDKNNHMGISRDSRHKRRLTGGRMPIHKKKESFRKKPDQYQTPSSSTIRLESEELELEVAIISFRALRLKEGNFNWASESVTRKTRNFGRCLQRL